MSKLILVTVGTSALFSEYSDWKNGSNDRYWDDSEELIEELETEPLNEEDTEYNHQKQQVLARLKKELNIYYANDEQGLDKLSAELASLLAMHKEPSIGNITNEDKIILLHSDTVDGRLCAEANVEVIQSFCTDTTIRPLLGIRVQPSASDENIRDSFVNRGLNSIQNEVKQAVKNFSTQHGNAAACYLNITGGYKGVLPFTTVLAHNYNLHLVYLYEKSQQIIWIAPSYWKGRFGAAKSQLGSNQILPIS